MNPEGESVALKQFTAVQALRFGTIAVGALDILDALIFFGFRGVPPIRIFQSIASGFLGRSAYDGGYPTAILGALLHFFIAFIAFCIVGVYNAASWRLPTLARYPCAMARCIGW